VALPDLHGFLARINGWPRRLLTVLCLVLAAGSALSAPKHPSSATTGVVVASRAIAGGVVLSAADVTVAHWPRSLRPPSAFDATSAVLGRRVAGAIGAGEALTSARVLGTGLTASLATGFSAVPVPLTDTGSAALIQAGDYADLISVDANSEAPAVMVASQILVIAVVAASTNAVGGQPAELVVAANPAQALRIAAVAGRGVFATVRAPP
jgi:pilus assembly protein CpaB